MKKLLIIASALAITAACTKTYDIEPVAQPEIGFGTWTEHLTKGRAQGADQFASGDKFAVSGFKTATSGQTTTNTPVFSSVEVSTTDGQAWTYTGTRFWDTNADSYTFFAVSTPVSGEDNATNLAVSNETATFGQVSASSVNFSGKNNDLLVADKVVVSKGASNYFNNYAAVNMQFNHVASLVDVKVKKSTSLADATVSVSALYLSGIQNNGTLSITGYSTTATEVTANYVNRYAPTVSSGSWTGTGTAATYYPQDGTTPVYGDTDATENISGTNLKAITTDTAFTPTTESTPAAATDLISGLIVMPQVFGGTTVSERSANDSFQKLNISYTISVNGGGSNDYTGTLYLADFDKIDNNTQQASDAYVASWEPGKHYTFYVTIDARGISFSAAITPWTSVSGFNYLLN